MKAFAKILLVISILLPASCFSLDPPPITPNDQFFVQNNGGGVQIPPPDWCLTVDGEILKPLSLTLEQIKEFREVELMATLECFANPLGQMPALFIGNAVWTGVRVKDLMQDAIPLNSAKSLKFYALDGWTLQISLGEIMMRDDIILAYGMNREILPPEQGYPLRLVTPGVSGSGGWMQWVTRIEVISQETPFMKMIPIHAQIFNPISGTTLVMGNYTIYGMAMIGGGEVSKVEVSTDAGTTWRQATLLNYFVPNVWKHWAFIWAIPHPGEYEIVVRAEDSMGNKQIKNDYFWGWRHVFVTVDDDIDQDGIPDSEDNCLNKPNGPNRGTCMPGSDKEGSICQTDDDCVIGCSSNGKCSLNQEDSDQDSFGDICDNCPYVCNLQQLDADKDGRGDLCDSAPGCGGCTGVECEQFCFSSTTTTVTPQYWHIDTCVQCHTVMFLHNQSAHNTCSKCHDGQPKTGSVSPKSCIICHPIGDSGKCYLINSHGNFCRSCHGECF